MTNFNPAAFKRRQAITLVELSLVLAIAAIIVFVALWAFSQAKENQRVDETANDIAQVRAAVESLAAGTGTYTGITPTEFKSSLPLYLYSGSTLYQPFGDMGEMPDNINYPGDSYDIAVNSLSEDACIRLGAMDMGFAAKRISINQISITDPIGSGTGDPLPISTMTPQAYSASKCTSGSNEITWQFN